MYSPRIQFIVHILFNCHIILVSSNLWKLLRFVCLYLAWVLALLKSVVFFIFWYNTPQFGVACPLPLIRLKLPMVKGWPKCWILLRVEDTWDFCILLLMLLLLLLSHFSHVRLSATPYRAAHQAPLSTGFSRQEYWSGVPFPSPFTGASTLHHLADKASARLLPWGFTVLPLCLIAH